MTYFRVLFMKVYTLQTRHNSANSSKTLLYENILLPYTSLYLDIETKICDFNQYNVIYVSKITTNLLKVNDGQGRHDHRTRVDNVQGPPRLPEMSSKNYINCKNVQRGSLVITNLYALVKFII